jgi:hypothetical protein
VIFVDSCIINPRSDGQVEVDIRSYCIGCAKEHTWRPLLSRVFLTASGIVTDQESLLLLAQGFGDASTICGSHCLNPACIVWESRLAYLVRRSHHRLPTAAEILEECNCMPHCQPRETGNIVKLHMPNTFGIDPNVRLDPKRKHADSWQDKLSVWVCNGMWLFFFLFSVAYLCLTTKPTAQTKTSSTKKAAKSDKFLIEDSDLSSSDNDEDHAEVGKRGTAATTKKNTRVTKQHKQIDASDAIEEELVVPASFPKQDELKLLTNKELHKLASHIENAVNDEFEARVGQIPESTWKPYTCEGLSKTCKELEK